MVFHRQLFQKMVPNIPRLSLEIFKPHTDIDILQVDQGIPKVMGVRGRCTNSKKSVEKVRQSISVTILIQFSYNKAT